MFHATARALNSVASQRVDDGGMLLTAQVEDAVDAEGQLADISVAAPNLSIVEVGIDQETLSTLHDEFRWAESKLMQASERLAEAQEARRKDLVALACMRRELRGSFSTERAYVHGQVRLFDGGLSILQSREGELAALVEGGARTAIVIGELAAVRTERKFFELAIAQATAQLARIEDNEATLEYEVANEAYEIEVDGNTVRETVRLKAAQARAHRAALRARGEAGDVRAALGIDEGLGEASALSTFLAAEFEGDERASARMDRLRARQVLRELGGLPEPTSSWKTGLLHPVSFFRARRVTTS